MPQSLRKRRLVKERDPRSVRQLAALFALCAAGATLFLFSLWQRVELTALHYRIEELSAEREALVQKQKELRLERSELQSLPRVESLARQSLGLGPPSPEQLFAVSDSGRISAVSALPGSSRSPR